MDLARKVKVYLLAPRPQYFPITVLPVILGGAISWYATGHVNPAYLGVAYLSAILLQGFTHVTNDYFDVKYGTDLPGSPTTRYRRHPIVEGDLTMKEVALEAAALVLISLGLGLALSQLGRPLVIPIGALAAVLCIEYTAPPLKAKYRALNQLVMFILEGPLLTLGTYYLETAGLSLLPVLASIPVAFIMCEVLLLDDLKDVDFDKKVGVRTIPVMYGKGVGSTVVLAELISAYVSLVALVWAHLIPETALITLVTLPLLLINFEKVVKTLPPTTGLRSMVSSILFGVVYAITILRTNVKPKLRVLTFT